MGRKVYRIPATLAAVIATLAVGVLAPIQAQLLPGAIPEPQEKATWCWVASDREIIRFFRDTRNQCAVANARLGTTNCCDAPLNCMVWGIPNPAALGRSEYETLTRAMTPGEIQTAIQTIKKPFAFSWYIFGGNHYMVGVGQDFSGEVLYYHNNFDKSLWGVWYDSYLQYNYEESPVNSRNVRAKN